MISSQSVAFLQYLNLILGGSRIFQGVSVCVCVCVWVGGGGWYLAVAVESMAHAQNMSQSENWDPIEKYQQFHKMTITVRYLCLPFFWRDFHNLFLSFFAF